MSSFEDLTGQKFGRLTVVSRAENGKHGKARWNCICDCGNPDKKDYEAYRSERMAYEAKNNAEYVAKIDKAFEQLEKVAEPKPDVSGLLEALKYVDVAISEVDKIKVNLLGIKAQITKFVK